VRTGRWGSPLSYQRRLGPKFSSTAASARDDRLPGPTRKRGDFLRVHRQGRKASPVEGRLAARSLLAMMLPSEAGPFGRVQTSLTALSRRCIVATNHELGSIVMVCFTSPSKLAEPLSVACTGALEPIGGGVQLSPSLRGSDFGVEIRVPSGIRRGSRESVGTPSGKSGIRFRGLPS
jgi:hypothetical protein